MSDSEVSSHRDVMAASRVLVFGGTTGIGLAVASLSLASRAKVYIASSNQSKVSTAVEQLRKAYPDGTVAGSVADLSNPSTVEASIKAVFDAALESLGGPLDHIVHTAGGMPAQPPSLATIDPTKAFDSWTVRYLTSLTIAKLVAANPGHYLKPQKTSSITLTSGFLFLKPLPGGSAFMAEAGAVVALTRGLAVDLAPIRCNIILPGTTRTPLLASMPAEMIDQFAQKALTKQAGTAEEVAESYLFAMRSAFFTGQEVVIDGGAVIKL